jgi:glycine/D-amino acid oxidase-like deaminating enzyme
MLKDLLTAEHMFPSKHPTVSYWQLKPHPLASAQSEHLASNTDTLIIGSGITGVSVAKHLFEREDDRQTVTLVDARNLCSGATGRNGGQLVTFGGVSYAKWKRAVGREEATRILRFQQETCDAVYSAACRYAKDESEIRKVTRIMAFQFAETVEEVRHSVDEYENDHPDCKGRYIFITSEEALQVNE